jgi:hypothetical protein
MGNVVEFTGITRLDGDPDRVLQGAIGELESVLVIGFTKQGGEFFSSSVPDGGTCLWLMERAKLKLLQVPERFDD